MGQLVLACPIVLLDLKDGLFLPGKEGPHLYCRVATAEGDEFVAEREDSDWLGAQVAAIDFRDKSVLPEVEGVEAEASTEAALNNS